MATLFSNERVKGHSEMTVEERLDDWAANGFTHVVLDPISNTFYGIAYRSYAEADAGTRHMRSRRIE